MSAKIPITFACGPYDRMSALERGAVKPAGIDLNYVTIDHPRDVFDRMIGGLEFDASELSASEYICRYSAGFRDLVAIPVFPSRVFRHGFIAVDGNIVKEPEDLNGKKIGVQLYTMTAAVWIRGVLQEAGVDLSSVTWVEGAVERPGSHGLPSAEPLLKPVNRVRNETDKSLSQLLEDGEIAATIGADLPPCLHTAPHIKRLYPDFKSAEQGYFRKTGIFPIMHLVAIKRSVLEQYPFIATSLFNAFNDSKTEALQQMRFLGALRYMLPWLPSELDEIDDVFASQKGDPFIYGLEENRKTLEALVGFLEEQGMIKEGIKIEELFADVRGQHWKI